MAWASWRCQRGRPSSSSAACLLLRITIVGVALLCLLSLYTVVANDGDELTAAAPHDGLTAADGLGGAMIPSYNSMASLQQALSHSSWGDGSGAGMGRSLLRRRKKDSDDDDEEEEEDDDDDDDDEDDNDDDDEEEDDDDDDNGKKKKKKKQKNRKKGMRSKTSALLGVQLDMTMLTSGGGSDDGDDEGEDEDEDDDRRRRRHLLAKPAAAAPVPSEALQTWASTSPLFPDGWLWVIGKLPRSEAEAGCKNVAGGTVDFSIDLKKMLQADGVDDGDDISPLKVVHHLKCVGPDDKDKSKMVLNKNIKTEHFFVVVQIKKVAAAVDCAVGAADCAVYGPKTMMPPEAIKQIEAKAAKGQRKLLMEEKQFTKEVTGKVTKGATQVTAKSTDKGTTRTADQMLKDAQSTIKKDDGGMVGTRYDGGPPVVTGDYSGPHPMAKGHARISVTKEDAPTTGEVTITFTIYYKTKSGKEVKEVVTVTRVGEVMPATGNCFPGAARVLLSNGTQATMQQLRHGDRVLTVLPGGQLGFSEVYLFGHKDPDSFANYVALQTEINSTLLATPDHYIHIIPRSKAAAGMPLSWKDAVHTRAGKVQPGDVMVHVLWDNCATPSDISSHKGSSCGSMQYVTITSAKMQVAKGLYNPYTMVGNIVVDGYSASSHSGLEFLDPLTGTGPSVPYLHQAMLAPVRLIHRLYPSLMAHVDQQYSKDAWASAGVAKIVGSIVQYHLKGV